MTDPARLMAATPGGLPYPLSTDRLNQGAVAIQQLAEALEQRGNSLLTLTGALPFTTDAAGNGAITYPVPFGAVPVVVCSPNVPNIVAMTAINTAVSTKAILYFTLIGVWPTNPAAPLVSTSGTLIYIAMGKPAA